MLNRAALSGQERTDVTDWRRKREARLQNIAKAAVARTLEKGAAEALRELRDLGAITPDQSKAWDGLRNKVMHGDLVSPYSSAEDDKLLLDLSDLLRAVTRRLIAPLMTDGTKVGGYR